MLSKDNVLTVFRGSPEGLGLDYVSYSVMRCSDDLPSLVCTGFIKKTFVFCVSGSEGIQFLNHTCFITFLWKLSPFYHF